jgi:Xaa-Pro aminopeptidase
MATPQLAAQSMIKQRREEFMRRIGRRSVAIFPSAPPAIRNADVEHEYRQESDFYYLSGFEEPNSALVLAPGNPKHKFVMFVQPKDREQEVWTGWRAGPEAAMRDYGADRAYTNDKLDKELPKLLKRADRLYYRFGTDPDFDRRVIKLMRHFQRERQRNGIGPSAVIDPADILHEMRLIKSDAELELLRRAIDISAEAHLAAMRALKPSMYEYEIEALLRYVFKKNASRRPGYPPIVASGPNATVLHYTANNRLIREGDLLLIDAGAEFGYYTGDITRTIPASGSYSQEQAAIYQIVLDAQLKAIAAVRPGARFSEPHNCAVRVLTEGMVRLGLLKGEVDELIEKGKYKKFYMHRTSHWLGMDVHDAGSYKVADQWRELRPGMVLTVEPGLYIAEDLEDVDPCYRGIGVRIEDDVLVTEDGNEVLSARVPKAIEEIESLMTCARSGKQEGIK